MLQLQDQLAGNQITFDTHDSLVMQIGYGNDMVPDTTNINVTDYYLNGVVSGCTTSISNTRRNNDVRF